MFEYYFSTFRYNYINFKGRARRKEVWYFIFINNIICMLLTTIPIITNNGWLIWLSFIYVIASLIPTLALLVRRMHDIGKSGKMILVAFIPLIGFFWILILLLTEGTIGKNKYGPNPKNPYQDLNEIGQTQY
ncbi:DUF805 domain-containing protein [Flavobacterium sp. RHBU_3]|uniref:DUF805 domain-containing protein n=1 Tax=Flavobacterium sp. RHBU_3 TaxID=3391184 RepID=UPI0039851A34